MAAGYNVDPAEAAIRYALRSDDLAPYAIPAAGRQATVEAQQELAGVALAEGRKTEVRVAAAAELTRHLQRYGSALSPAQAQQVKRSSPAVRGRPRFATAWRPWSASCNLHRARAAAG